MKSLFFHTTSKFFHIFLNKISRFSAEEKAKPRIDYKTWGEKWLQEWAVFFSSNKESRAELVVISTC
jgi:hypothetical protein